ncbi:hypothetical protein ACWECR_29000 [Streptomyces sp. NPDC005056]
MTTSPFSSGPLARQPDRGHAARGRGKGRPGLPPRGTGREPLAVRRILPDQIRDIVLATSDMHPTLDDVSRKVVGDAYASRWDPERTAWMRDTTHTPATDAPAQSAGSTGGLNLSALRDDRESAEEALARKFREQIDAEFATFADPGTNTEHPTAGGLNLSALQNEDNAARQAALALLLAAGPDGTGASAIARALADEHGTTRQTVVGWLKTWTEDGTAVRVGTGTKARYVHHRHVPNRPAED